MHNNKYFYILQDLFSGKLSYSRYNKCMSNNAKILIVEDEPQINRLIELVLISGGFYRISKAFDGEEALKIMREEKPDLVLLDVMLPKIDGYTLCNTIKKDVFLKSIKIIMLTAKKMEEDILKGFENGAIDYISKPFSNNILLARIKAHLSNIDEKSDIYNNVKINDLKKTVCINDEVVDLTKFEYEIIKLLVSSPGVVFSRSQILEFLRGNEGYNISERAIDVQIVNLRRKLKDFGTNIETVRGIGYKLKEKGQ